MSEKQDYRHLTEQEIAFLKPWFKDTIDYENVKIHSRPYLPGGLQSDHTAMAPNGHLYMPDTLYKEDYTAQDVSLSLRSTFLHEMTHVWQFKNNVLNPIVEAAKESMKHKFNYNAAYDYVLEKGKDLVNYGMEQQASIVQDYFLLKESGHVPRALTENGVTTAAAATELYESVLENFLKDPSYPQNCKHSITGKAYLNRPRDRKNGYGA